MLDQSSYPVTVFNFIHSIFLDLDSNTTTDWLTYLSFPNRKLLLSNLTNFENKTKFS